MSRDESTIKWQKPHFSLWFRGLLLGIGIGLFGLLGLARTLQPDPSGHGTHQQLLDLPPCGFLMMFGYPCPSCGMTTSWALLTRGNFVASAQANAGGLLLAVLTLASAVTLTGSAVCGRWVVKPTTIMIISLMMIVILSALGHWLIKILS